MNIKERKKNWSNYWKSNSIDSCSQGVKSTDSEIDTFWKDTAKSLNKDSQVLDLCTGRGDVVDKMISAQESAGKDISHYTGVDLSEIPSELAMSRFKSHAQRVNLNYGTSVAALPYDDNKFDLVTSQFGIEYAVSKDSLIEIFRVLKNEGKLRLVIHHQNSILTKVAKEERSHIEYLIDESNFFDLAQKLIPVFAKLRNPANAEKLNKDQEAISLRSLFNNASKGILDRAAKSNHPDALKEVLSFTEGLFRVAREQGVKPAKDELSKYIDELKQSKVRMQELIDCAFTEEDIKGLEQQVNQLGHKIVKTSELTSKSYIVAWGLEIS
ncbi:class I SAM-dependent methyltransferase [Kangiella sediminilitoris]|uniref:Methyltransferase domain-containing protein n=1 Tax=Kangiella sediminilitoris TaxID=1144748 RepID=A0A1B3B8C3_9GAMM|nr:class I SAM-dependent methyltransferase [Kangiella sediminilitoris]AOE49052.1 hypothetical protein KS2013_326 [Kangiella sediminilitoris]